MWFLSISLFVYGILIEVIQNQTTYRAAELGDILANAFGILIGALIFKIAHRFNKRPL